jgi:hypothetical protein
LLPRGLLLASIDLSQAKMVLEGDLKLFADWPSNFYGLIKAPSAQSVKV